MLASLAILAALVAWGTPAIGWGLFVGVAIMVVFALTRKESPPIPPWICSSCGARETNFTRQCGACRAWKTARLVTKRLVLREWTDFDLPAFAALNADPRVMEFLPKTLDREESDALAARIREGFPKHGFGLWAVEISGVADFAGFIGLSVPNFTAPFTPCVEVGYRLAFDHWGKGYATEGALAALEFGFTQAGLTEIVSFTVPDNIWSRHVMQKCGLTRDPADDFDHPKLPEGHRLRRHVLYRISRPSPSGRR